MRGGEGGGLGGGESLIRLGTVSSAILMRVRSIRLDRKEFEVISLSFFIISGGTTWRGKNRYQGLSQSASWEPSGKNYRIRYTMFGMMCSFHRHGKFSVRESV